MAFGTTTPRVLAAPLAQAPASPATSGAPPAPSPETEKIFVEARLHFEAGTDHYAAGRYEEAIQRFQAGYSLVPRPNFLVNIGQAYRKLGNLVRAKEAYAAYVRALPEKSALRDQALQVLAEIDLQLQDQAGGSFSLGLAGPGQGTIPNATVPAQITTPPPPASRLGAWLGLGMGGAGLALVATGVGFQLRAKAASDSLAAASKRDEVFDLDEERAGKRAEKIGNGLFAAGGAVMAAGLLLFLVIDAATGPSQASAAPRLALQPEGFALGWRF